MYGGDPMQLVYLLAALVLPLSALAAYRLSWKKGLAMALVWASIFAGVTLFVGVVMG
jgi:hypothetical protein